MWVHISDGMGCSITVCDIWLRQELGESQCPSVCLSYSCHSYNIQHGHHRWELEFLSRPHLTLFVCSRLIYPGLLNNLDEFIWPRLYLQHGHHLRVRVSLDSLCLISPESQLSELSSPLALFDVAQANISATTARIILDTEQNISRRMKMFSRRCTFSLQSWQSRKIHQNLIFFV